MSRRLAVALVLVGAVAIGAVVLVQARPEVVDRIRYPLRYEAIVTPAAPGEAPSGLESTGDPAFSTLWTYCGVPALTLPLLTGPNGMPVGVQLVGRRFYDGRLLRTARWLSNLLREEGQDIQSVVGAVA